MSNTEEQSLRKLVLRAINFNTDATSIAHDIENLIADHQALIETEKREAYRQGGIDGAQAYNRVLTAELGKCTYGDLDGERVGIYKQEWASNAIQAANMLTIIKPGALTTKAEREES